jgi:hypothetical protein
MLENMNEPIAWKRSVIQLSVSVGASESRGRIFVLARMQNISATARGFTKPMELKLTMNSLEEIVPGGKIVKFLTRSDCKRRLIR